MLLKYDDQNLDREEFKIYSSKRWCHDTLESAQNLDQPIFEQVWSPIVDNVWIELMITRLALCMASIQWSSIECEPQDEITLILLTRKNNVVILYLLVGAARVVMERVIY